MPANYATLEVWADAQVLHIEAQHIDPGVAIADVRVAWESVPALIEILWHHWHAHQQRQGGGKDV